MASPKSPAIEQVIARDLHNLLYLEEFVFPSSKFTPLGKSEVELADAVVALDDTLFIYQIKERDLGSAGDEDAERKWFNKKVLKEATRQIRETLQYLESLSSLEVANSRGRAFNLAAENFSSVVKIIVYKSALNLPSDCKNVRFYRSSIAGFIHILEYSDYIRMSEFLRVPEEIRLYFAHREKVLTEHPEQCGSLPEACLVGGFIGSDDEDRPSNESYRHLHATVDDEQTWNLIPLLRGLHDHQSREEYSDDYYRILAEFMRLPRSLWREVKRRIELSIQKVTADEFALPYRVSYPARDVGIVVVPVTSEYAGRPDWDELKVRMLIMMADLHKFDHKLSKSIGILIAKVGKVFDIQWCMIEGEWVDNPEIRARLEADSPFRSTSEKTMYGFYTRD